MPNLHPLISFQEVNEEGETEITTHYSMPTGLDATLCGMALEGFGEKDGFEPHLPTGKAVTCITCQMIVKGVLGHFGHKAPKGMK